MAGVDDTIKKWVSDVEKSGDIKANKGWGKPLNLNDGYEQTPEEVRMAYRMLKNAGYLPWEVETLNKIADLKAGLKAASPNTVEAKQLQKRIADLEQQLHIRLTGNKV